MFYYTVIHVLEFMYLICRMVHVHEDGVSFCQLCFGDKGLEVTFSVTINEIFHGL